MNKYYKILDFLSKYSGKQYKLLDKCDSIEEEAFMRQGKADGIESWNLFKEIISIIESSTSFKNKKLTQWQNSGNFVRYIWCQFKNLQFENSNISVSLFAETANKISRFRISVELEERNASNEDIEKYKRILDLPLKTDLVYILGGNNSNEFETLSETDNKIVKLKNYPKVQVSKIFQKEDKISDKVFIDNIISGINELTEYYSYCLTEHENKWFPSIDEYNPGITNDQWIDFLINYEIPNHIQPIQMLKGMMELGGMANFKQLAEKYGNTPNSYVGRGTSFGRRALKHFGIEAWKDDNGDESWYYVAFQLHYESKDNFAWRIRPELQEALKEINLENINPYDKGGEPEMTTKQMIDEIKKYIASKGFTYEGNLIENFYLSLKSKPFVILAGTSGTGKTRLAKLFAEAIGAKFRLVPVRPDWSDSSDLFGHLDLSGNFIAGPVIGFISEAIKNPSKPYILCLDEMNLARVEYYFSDFLSIMETRERKGGRIVTDKFDLCKKATEEYGEIYIPDNFYIVGTVNMDETTFPFSKKVLDRANTIEFSYVDLSFPKDKPREDDAVSFNVDNSFLKTNFIRLGDWVCDTDTMANADFICSEVQSINKMLETANAHVGYRVRDEICFYMFNNFDVGSLIDYETAMDNQIMQKILPRIQGSSSTVKTMLCELFKHCAGDFKGYQTDGTVADEMKKVVDQKNCRYQKSAEKIQSMTKRFEEDGFTSYWI